MNPILSLVQAARTTDDRNLSSDPMFTELLRLHEEMIAQLRRERPAGISSADFLHGMIEQHENAAIMLRDRLEHTAVKSL